jgi:hypothetical protein
MPSIQTKHMYRTLCFVLELWYKTLMEQSPFRERVVVGLVWTLSKALPVAFLPALLSPTYTINILPSKVPSTRWSSKWLFHFGFYDSDFVRMLHDSTITWLEALLLSLGTAMAHSIQQKWVPETKKIMFLGSRALPVRRAELYFMEMKCASCEVRTGL